MIRDVLYARTSAICRPRLIFMNHGVACGSRGPGEIGKGGNVGRKTMDGDRSPADVRCNCPSRALQLHRYRLYEIDEYM